MRWIEKVAPANQRIGLAYFRIRVKRFATVEKLIRYMVAQIMHKCGILGTRVYRGCKKRTLQTVEESYLCCIFLKLRGKGRRRPMVTRLGP